MSRMAQSSVIVKVSKIKLTGLNTKTEIIEVIVTDNTTSVNKCTASAKQGRSPLRFEVETLVSMADWHSGQLDITE